MVFRDRRFEITRCQWSQFLDVLRDDRSLDLSGEVRFERGDETHQSLKRY